MSRLCIDLPPFASDYSGACSCLFELNGMVIIHDAHCCSLNYISYDEPRWFGNKRPIFCSGLRELDAVLGNDEILIEKIAEAAFQINPEFIVVLGSPVPTIVGADMTGIAEEIEDRTGIKSFGFTTTGLRYYNKGAGEVMTELIRYYADYNVEPILDGVNILGLTPLDFSDNQNVHDVIKLVRAHSFTLVSGFMTNNCSLESIAACTQARVNLVVAQSGMAPALYMEREWGIPWLAAVPMGNKYSKIIMTALREVMESGCSRALHAPGLHEGKVLAVGEQLQGNGLRNALANYGIYGVDVACLFGLDQRLSQPWDIDIHKEKELRTLLASGKYHTIIADPTVERLLDNDNCVIFPIPHVAVSSKLFWHDYKVFQSIEMERMLAKIAGRDTGTLHLSACPY